MRSLTVLLMSLYCLYHSTCIAGKSAKRNFIRGLFIFTSWLLFVVAVVLCIIGI